MTMKPAVRQSRRPARLRLALWVVTVTLAGPTPASAAQDPGARGDSLGTVHFPISCSSRAQADFDRAMALLHHMTYPQARTAFANVAAVDPRCGMAHWGRALGMLDNPFLWPGSLSPKVLGDGQAAIDAARAGE